MLFVALNWTILVFERVGLESGGGWEGGLLISRGTVVLLLLRLLSNCPLGHSVLPEISMILLEMLGELRQYHCMGQVSNKRP